MPVNRIGVSVPPGLLKDFDQTIRKMGFKDRSKAIQVAIRNFITELEQLEEEGESVGAIIFLFDHNVRGLEDTLTCVQHSHRDIINSTMHIHLDEQNCLEILAIRGKAQLVKRLTQQLSGVRGIKQIKLVRMHTR
ncbi:MAG: nickel-responsive transcriptional regulator NikR [Candidatus Bathycorpusculaceae bacterium]